MPFPPEFIRWVEDQLAELRSQLEVLESGRTTLGKRSNGGWVDITSDEIARLRRHITDLERVLDRHREQ